MLIEIARPVRRWPARAAPRTELERALEVAEFHAEPGERREGVDDESTRVAGVVIAFVGIRFRLDRPVDADKVSDSLIFSPSMRLANLGTGRRVAERTASERLLHHSPSASVSRAAVQPRWKTASCVDKSNTVPLGS